MTATSEAEPRRQTRRRTSAVAPVRPVEPVSDAPRSSPPAIDPAPDFAALLAALWRIAAGLTGRTERDLAGEAAVSERDVKLATALAVLVGKIRDLETTTGKASDADGNGKADTSDDELGASILDTVEAFIDGRAAGLFRTDE